MGVYPIATIFRVHFNTTYPGELLALLFSMISEGAQVSLDLVMLESQYGCNSPLPHRVSHPALLSEMHEGGTACFTPPNRKKELKGDGELPSRGGSTFQCKSFRNHRFDPWVGKIPGRRKWQPTPVLLPGKFHGQRERPGGLQSLGSQGVRCD